MTSKSSKVKVTIPASSTSSTEIEIQSGSLVGVQFPSAFTGTSITFKSSNNQDDTKLTHYTKAGSALTITFVASIVQQIDANDTTALGQFVQVVSNGTEASERVFYLIIRDLD